MYVYMNSTDKIVLKLNTHPNFKHYINIKKAEIILNYYGKSENSNMHVKMNANYYYCE